MSNMLEVRKSLNVILNSNTFPVMIYKDIFNASSLISPPSLNDDEDFIFKEEFIGTSMANGDRNDHAPSSNRCSDSSEEEKFKATHPPISSHRTSSEPGIGSDRDSNDAIVLDSLNNGQVHCVIEPVPDLHAPLEVVGDQELDELLSCFHRISDLANEPRPTDGKKKRTKHKKKKLMVKSFVDCESSLFVVIHETKSDSINDFFIRSIWPRPYIEYAFTSSVSASVGILTLWDNQSFTVEHKIVDRNFVGVVGSWHRVASKVGLVNIYAPQGSNFEINEVNYFDDFIWRNGLVDIP
ncbi:hypothetical protein Tco_1541596 [Tanacetum coccineum]